MLNGYYEKKAFTDDFAWNSYNIFSLKNWKRQSIERKCGLAQCSLKLQMSVIGFSGKIVSPTEPKRNIPQARKKNKIKSFPFKFFFRESSLPEYT